MVRIIKCICHGTTFARLKKIAQEEDLQTIEDLQKRATFADNCRRCVPYVRLMLETGQTEFDLLDEESAEILEKAPATSKTENYGDENEL